MNIVPLYSRASSEMTGDSDSYGSISINYTDLEHDLNTLLIENPSATFVGRSVGDSMIDVGIFSGDILIIDRKLQVKDFDIIVSNFNGEFVCKMLDMKNRLLLSANQKYQPIPILESDVFTIEGVVARSLRMFRGSHLLSSV